MWNETVELLSDPQIITEIQNLSVLFIQFCQSRNKRVSQRVALTFIKLNLLDPKSRFMLSTELKNTKKQMFLEVCYKYWFEEQSISKLTIKMQCLFHERYLNREAFKDHQKQIVWRKCCHLNHKLKKSWHNPSEDFREMHNDLVKLIVIKEGMDGDNDASSFDEMRMAVNNIFPPSALSTFVVGNRKTKMAFINEISSIAAGIRLHAWYSQKAGTFMCDGKTLGKIMKETLPVMNEDLNEEFAINTEKLRGLQEELKETILKSSEEVDIKYIYEKAIIVLLENYCNFIKLIKECIQEVAVQTYKLDYTFHLQMEDLDSALKTKSLTTINKVYSLYKNIARTWKNIQLEGFLLNFYSNLYQELKIFPTQIHSMKPREIIDISQIPINFSEEVNKAIKILPGDVKNFDTISLEYGGYCTFYCSKGVLIPCNRKIGIFMYRNLCYGFSNLEGAQKFTENPSQCILNVKRHILAMPELIMTLKSESCFNLPLDNVFKTKRESPVFVSDNSCQTLLHATEEKVDYTYNWNQWNLRKNALKYVDLLGKRTHSTQTDLSHFRRENDSQVYVPKDQCTQTRKDACTNISKFEIPELLLKLVK